MILHPTNIAHFVMIFVQKTDKIFRQDKNLSYCECLVRFPDKKNTHYSADEVILQKVRDDAIFYCTLTWMVYGAPRRFRGQHGALEGARELKR